MPLQLTDLEIEVVVIALEARAADVRKQVENAKPADRARAAGIAKMYDDLADKVRSQMDVAVWAAEEEEEADYAAADD